MNVAPVAVFLVSTTGDAAETVTSSVICSDLELLIDAGVEAGGDHDVRTRAFLKLASSNVTVKVPIGTLGNW